MRYLLSLLFLTLSGCAMPLCETSPYEGFTTKPCLGMCEFSDRLSDHVSLSSMQIAVMDEDASGAVTCEKVSAVYGVRRQ